MTRTLCALALVFTSLVSRAGAADFDQARTSFNVVLKQYVKNARVDYASLKAHPQDLNHYLDEVAAVKRTDFEKWSQAQQIAFLINAYNAYTLKLIVDHYPINSIKDIGHVWSGPWDQPVVNLFGQTITLNTVEHKILRVNYSEPRIHFALVCAAKGCPPLRDEAYVATRLDEQFDDQTRQFLATTAKNRVDAASQTVYLSPIFKWYGGDFEKKYGSVLGAIKTFWPTNQPLGQNYADYGIRYTDYDWSLNETENR